MDFFIGLVEWSEGDTSFVTNVWTWASHPGEAVHRMLETARSNEIPNPKLIDLDCLDFEDLADGAVPVDGGSSFIENDEYSFPTDYAYKFPHGVIATRDTHDTDVDEIRPGYEISKNDDGLIVIEAVIEENQLLEIYLEFIDTLPSIRTFWIKIQEDWEEFGTEEIYDNQQLNTLSKIRNFLIENEKDTVLNGHVTLTAYADEGQTNLSISDHKIIDVLTYDKALAKKICKKLEQNGLNKFTDLLSVAYGVHHWHYRHPNGLDRGGLVEMLSNAGFELWVPKTSETI